MAFERHDFVGDNLSSPLVMRLDDSSFYFPGEPVNGLQFFLIKKSDQLVRLAIDDRRPG